MNLKNTEKILKSLNKGCVLYSKSRACKKSGPCKPVISNKNKFPVELFDPV